ncbi:Fibronectin type III domain protein [Minicystis rosea]|nr:Fibronectin type III domain protein [Minicystis rosea]
MRLSKTILSSPIVLAAFFAASGQALAGTTATIPTGATSSTVDIGSLSEWVRESTKYGSFGAGFDATDSISATTGNVLKESVGATASIELFGETIDLVGFSVWAKNNASSAITAGVTQTAFGATVVDVPLAITNANASLTGAVCVSTTDLDVGEATIMVGPIPIYMSVSAAACPQLSFSGSGTYTAGSYSDLSFTVTPNFDVSASAQIGIGTSVVSAGIKGSLTLLNVGLPITNTLSYTNALRQMQYGTSGTLTIETLSGSFALYASAGWGPFSVEYDYTLFDWDGFNWTYGVFSDVKPTATDVQLSISGGTVTGSYQYNGSGAAEGTSTFKIQRALSSSGAGLQDNISTSKTYSLTTSDQSRYLRFCVVPHSHSDYGAEACSSWVSVGSLLTVYQDANLSGTTKYFAYEKADSGECFSLSDVSFNDKLTSFVWRRPSIKPGASTLVFYKDGGCSGSTITAHDTDASGTTLTVNSVSDTYGSSWNDNITSFRVFYNEVVTAEDLDISWTGPYAKPTYTFADTSGVAESGSKFQWQRADDPAGTNATTIQSYGTTSQYALTTSDQDKFLRVCVIPSNGFVTGGEVCTDFLRVGKLLSVYKNSNYGGSALHFPYERWTSGSCISLSAYGMQDDMSSYTVGYTGFSNPDGGTYGVTFYKDGGCSGGTLTSTFSTSGGTNSSSYVGSSWNDEATSFKVVYRKVDALNPNVAWGGPRALPRYQFASSTGSSEAGSTYQWEAADDINGANHHVVQGYSTTKEHNVAPMEQGKYLRLCIKPSDGVVVGPESCTNYSWVGNLVSVYPNGTLGGPALSFPYQHIPSGKCMNLTDFGFNDVASSLQSTSNAYSASGSYGVVLYQDINCKGPTFSSSFSTAGGTSTVNGMGGFDNQASSIRIYFDN